MGRLQGKVCWYVPKEGKAAKLVLVISHQYEDDGRLLNWLVEFQYIRTDGSVVPKVYSDYDNGPFAVAVGFKVVTTIQFPTNYQLAIADQQRKAGKAIVCHG